MNAKVLSILFTAFLFLSFSATSQSWERLGTRKVNYLVERDVIHVGAKEGGFTKLKVVVNGGAINMRRMIVEYMNGTKEEIELRHNFRRGSTSRIIDIQGGKRLIKEITFIYDTKNLSRSRARLTVFGRH